MSDYVERHVRPDGSSAPCLKSRFGQCRLCDLLDKTHPDYEEAYRRRYYPEEFPATETPPEPWKAPEPIGLLAKAANLATATAGHLIAGLPVADEATQADRMAICRACVGPHGGVAEGPGYWDAPTGECRHPTCNCLMKVKTWWLEQKCPIDKW